MKKLEVNKSHRKTKVNRHKNYLFSRNNLQSPAKKVPSLEIWNSENKHKVANKSNKTQLFEISDHKIQERNQIKRLFQGKENSYSFGFPDYFYSMKPNLRTKSLRYLQLQ